MMKHLLLLTVVAVALAVRVKPVGIVEDPADQEVLITEKFVSEINARATTWTASADQGPLISNITIGQARRLMGVKRGAVRLPKKTFTDEERAAVPDTFDARTNWPNCWQIRRVRDQSACGSCWAFAAVEAMSDRECIFNKVNVSISAQDMNSCCTNCGGGCGGGDPASAWNYWQSTGVVDSECSAYSLPSCDHHLDNSTNPCPSDEYDTPPCVQTCADGRTWQQAKWMGQTAYSITTGEADMMTEIFQNGPVETAFTVYSDFLTYKSGVYQQTSGDPVGGHAVKILGWGKEGGVPYWLCANSWNVHWGDKGFFKILRGQDECGIEDEIDAGVPAAPPKF